MAIQSLPARLWKVEVDTSTTSTPSWVPIKGLNEITESIDTNTEDDSDFEGEGWGSNSVTQRSWSLELNGMRKVSQANAAAAIVADPGQEKVRLAGEEVGLGSNVHVRWYQRIKGGLAYEGYGSTEYAPGSRKTTDLESFQVTVNGQGARTSITNPFESA